MKLIALWLGLMCPLILSPGPANLCIAGVAARTGFRSTISAMAGFTTINLVMSFSMGMLFIHLTDGMPVLFSYIEVIGAAYVFYLGLCFMKTKSTSFEESEKHQRFGYRSAFFLQLLNGKLYPTLIMMFSVFTKNASPPFSEIAYISLALCGLALASYIIWSALGSLLKRFLAGQMGLFVQRYVFGGVLLLIGIKLIADVV